MAELDPQLTRRIQVAVTAVILGLVGATLASWTLGFWPWALVNGLQVEWLGRVSARATFAGIFGVYGGILLAALVPLVAARLLYDRLTHRG